MMRLKRFLKRLSTPASIQADYSMIGEPRQAGVSVTAIFKNEAQYLKEWIEYHLLIGVSHFYLYDNGSEDNPLQVLAPYIQEEIVTLIPWVAFEMRLNSQRLAYRHSAMNFGANYQWMAFIDLDEFIVPNKDIRLVDFLSNNTNYAVIHMPLIEFDHNGHIEKPKGFVTENYFNGCNLGREWRVKPILQARLVETIETLRPKTKHPVFAIEELPQPQWPIRINHYFSKSLEEYAEKRARGWAVGTVNDLSRKDVIFEYINKNGMKQNDIEPYLVDLRARVGGNTSTS